MSVPTARRRVAGMLFAAVSAASFGAMPIFARYAYADGVTPTTLLAFRFTLASAIMLATRRARRKPLPRGARLVGLVLMGAVGYVGQVARRLFDKPLWRGYRPALLSAKSSTARVGLPEVETAPLRGAGTRAPDEPARGCTVSPCRAVRADA